MSQMRPSYRCAHISACSGLSVMAQRMPQEVPVWKGLVLLGRSGTIWIAAAELATDIDAKTRSHSEFAASTVVDRAANAAG